MTRALICCALLVAGCATTANYQEELQSWVGAPADRLVATWGPPQSSYALSDGGQVLEYVSQGGAHGSSGEDAQGMYSGTVATYVQHQTPVYNMERMCVTRFTVNPQGIITGSASKGNNCKARS